MRDSFFFYFLLNKIILLSTSPPILFLTGYFSNLYSTRNDPNFLSILRVFVDSIEIGWKFLIKGIPNYGSSLSYIIGHWGEFFSSLSLSLWKADRTRREKVERGNRRAAPPPLFNFCRDLIRRTARLFWRTREHGWVQLKITGSFIYAWDTIELE